MYFSKYAAQLFFVAKVSLIFIAANGADHRARGTRGSL
jgi:hypothetical protein